jgi:hypothetical protein
MNIVQLISELVTFVYDSVVFYLGTTQGQQQIETIIATFEGNPPQTPPSGSSAESPTGQSVLDKIAELASKRGK